MNHYQSAEELFLASLGRDHSALFVLYNNMAGVYLKRGELIYIVVDRMIDSDAGQKKEGTEMLHKAAEAAKKLVERTVILDSHCQVVRR